MNSEMINTIEETRKQLRKAVGFLRKTAKGESVRKKAAADTVSLNAGKVREVFEEMVAVNLAKAAEIEPAVQRACSDPNVLLDAMRKLTLRVAAAQESVQAGAEPRRPGQLVKKTASAYVRENGVQRMKRLCEERARQLP